MGAELNRSENAATNAKMEWLLQMLQWIGGIAGAVALFVLSLMLQEFQTLAQTANEAAERWTVASDKIHNLDVRVTAIEANRLTSDDATSLYRAMVDLQKQIAAQSTDAPKWVVDRIDRIERRLELVSSPR